VIPMFDTGLARYLREIHKLPLLTLEEEYMLAKRWRENGDLGAVQRLVTSHLRLVAKVAMQYRGYGRPISELVSEGSVGLLQAAKRFDPDRGFRLATYAIWWIRAAIMEYILQSRSLVKMGTTGAQKKLFFNLRRLKGRLQVIDDGDPPPEAVKKIAAELCVSEADVVSMNRRLAAPDYSLNTPLDRAGAEGAGEWLTLLVDDAPDQETVVVESAERRWRRQLVRGALKHLDPRERDIILQRRFKNEPTTFGDLGERYSVSAERIRQIEGHALEKIRRTVRLSMIPAYG
jgi:RNA polymerase sigma-32 factor